MRDKAIVAYSAMSPKNQARFLVRLGFEMTVWARGAYSSLTSDHSVSANLLQAYNELQHKISAQLMHLLYEDDHRYPDDVFINILFDMTMPAECEDKLVSTFDKLHGSYLRSLESQRSLPADS
jgi:hypothetical protein